MHLPELSSIQKAPSYAYVFFGGFKGFGRNSRNFRGVSWGFWGDVKGSLGDFWEALRDFLGFNEIFGKLRDFGELIR